MARGHEMLVHIAAPQPNDILAGLVNRSFSWRPSSTGRAVQDGLQNLATPEELLRYAMSLPVATTICGMESIDKLRANLRVAQGFTPMSAGEMAQLRERCRPTSADGGFELYKVSLAFDNPEARRAHGFPTDPKQMEIKEELDHAMGTDKQQ
jgi:hypothetical protein